eukprot:TRINITY_DN4713_c0_g1_i1.p1 TRINITY_DN4713_c0_g1~~TRINITY_DN4713_c0_g1_i1.p1  ORF type:complete len:247 (-),score=35.97 TRINITY_DN4713_c0_g1_i1:274-1014(-)
MSVHFKFKAARDYDTVTFEGGFISLADLKKAIVQKKKLGKGNDFDLVVTNAQSQEDYKDDNFLIPKNTSVIVRRVPILGNQLRSGPANTATTSSYSTTTTTTSNSSTSLNTGKVSVGRPPQKHEDADEFGSLLPDGGGLAVLLGNGSKSEDDKLAALIDGAGGYQNSNLAADQKRGVNGNAPTAVQGTTDDSSGGQYNSNYICHRCNQPGHFISQCPTNNDPTFDFHKVKKPVGIPKMFLKKVQGG